MVFARLLAEIVEEMRAKGIDPCSTEIPVDVLGAKYKWARGAGLL